MKNHRKIRYALIMLSGFFLFIDQWLKWQSMHDWANIKLLCPYFGWRPFLNQGVAFGILLPNSLTVIFTILIIVAIIILLFRDRERPFLALAWLLILTGAASNLFDRLFYGYVIDYLALLTGIINLADILIIAGLSIYLLRISKLKICS